MFFLSVKYRLKKQKIFPTFHSRLKSKVIQTLRNSLKEKYGQILCVAPHTHTKTHKVVNMWWQVHRGGLKGVPPCLTDLWSSICSARCNTLHVITTLRSLFCCPVFQLVTDDDCCDISAGQLLAHTSLQCVNVTGESVSTMHRRGLLYVQPGLQEWATSPKSD